MEMFKTLVISGGSVKGLLAIGALHYVEYSGFLESIDIFYGTSIGSMISLLLAVGYKPIDLALIFKKTNISINSILTKTDCQVFDYDEIMDNIKEAFIRKTGVLLTFTELYKRYKKDLFFITFNYSKGIMEVLSRKTHPNMCCIEAVKLSCALPFLFKKCIYNGDMYVDGGFANNFPLDLAVKCHKSAGKILGLKIDSTWQGRFDDNLVAITANVFFAPIILKMREVAETFAEDCVLVDLISDITPFELKIEIFQIISLLNEGYEQARRSLEVIFHNIKTTVNIG